MQASRTQREGGGDPVILLESRRSGWQFGAVTLKRLSTLHFEKCYNIDFL